MHYTGPIIQDPTLTQNIRKTRKIIETGLNVEFLDEIHSNDARIMNAHRLMLMFFFHLRHRSSITFDADGVCYVMRYRWGVGHSQLFGPGLGLCLLPFPLLTLLSLLLQLLQSHALYLPPHYLLLTQVPTPETTSQIQVNPAYNHFFAWCKEKNSSELRYKTN